MQQNTKIWLEERKKGIGSSDAPIIMNNSKYMTPYQLFLEKLSPVTDDDLRSSFVQELGHIFEPKALAHLALSVDVSDFMPTVFQHKEINWLKASLDGYSDSSNIAVEIKYVGADRFKWVQENKKPLPDHWDQVQHILMVSGARKLIYCCYTLSSDRKTIADITWHDVEFDRDYIENNLFPAEKLFWENVTSGNPPDLSEKDEKELTDSDHVILASEYIKINSEKKELEKKLKEIESQLKSLAMAEKVSKLKVGNITMTRSIRKGSVDYKSIPALKDIDLDSYRKASTTYVTIRSN